MGEQATVLISVVVDKNRLIVLRHQSHQTLLQVQII